MRSSPGRQRGMGIIEFMVAMLIGLVMAVALAWFYLGSRSLSRVSEDVSRLQESGRGALEVIGMAVRQAGYRNNINAAFNGKPLDGTNGANNAPDTITVRFDAQEGGELDCTGGTVATGATVQYIFAVDRSTNPPGLTCNGTRIVDNVEDMQISYGIDANHDGTIELYKSQPSTTEFFDVAAVQVALLMRGPTSMTAANKRQTVSYNGGNPVEYTDGYLRQAYNGTFTVRPQAY